MKRINYRDYEDIVTEAVMNVIDGRYNKPLVTEGLGGGVLGLLAFFLALFGIPLLTSSKSTTSSASTTATTDNSAQQTSQQTNQQTTQQQNASQADKNYDELEKLAKNLKLEDVMKKFNGRNIEYDPQYAKPLTPYGGKVFYTKRPNAYLQPSMITKLDKVLKTLEASKVGLLIWDATRPNSVQAEMIDAAKAVDGKKYKDGFIASPGKSQHNVGKAVDCTLYDLKTKQPLDMGGHFDERTSASHTNHYQKKNIQIHKRRMLLRNAMQNAGISGINSEWWHFQIK